MDKNEMRQRATTDRDCTYFFPFRDPHFITIALLGKVLKL